MKGVQSCEICRRPVPPGAGYVVRIDVFADPELPALSQQEIDAADLDRTLVELIEEMKHLSADELQDGVHRRFEYRLCPVCQKKFLANPLGMPRVMPVGEN